ncbi:NAD(P)-binding domain-containing protein, partial [Pseudorhodoplanes sp.]|uniref:NAD(P)-binding domain-containing protein n=1 Tax=Pseudorhodoplanes sp. TaxID=1934341 RepID=UPI00391AED89
MTTIKTVGFIGIGNMGAPMAANVKKGGFEVVAFDLDPARAKAFARQHGARATDQLAELGEACDAVVTMLPTGK